MTSIVDHFERMQLIKCELLKRSVDSTVSTLYHLREEKNANLKRVWKASNLSKIANAEVNLNIHFPLQTDRQGIGFGNFNPNPTPSDRRKLVIAKAQFFSEQKRIAHASTLQRQGIWLKWSENTIPFDFSWQNLIWNYNAKIISFVLNASVNWVKTPDLLHLWGMKTSACCTLCRAEKCTLHHILSNCKTALTTKR